MSNVKPGWSEIAPRKKDREIYCECDRCRGKRWNAMPGEPTKAFRRRYRRMHGEISRIQEPTGKLYWAYGSNLSHENMQRRCPDARPFAPLVLDNGSLVFRGVADVTTRDGGAVPGGLWRITPRCEAELDRYEGVSSKFYLKRYLTLKVENRVEECLFYQMRMSRGIMPPTEKYLEIIERGYRDFGLDLAYLDQAVAESWENKQITPVLRERHQRRGAPKLARINNPASTRRGGLQAAG